VDKIIQHRVELKPFSFVFLVVFTHCFGYGLPFFFFLNQQFITWCAEADCGSYFRNYIQKTHTNLKLKERREKKKEKDKGTNRQVEKRKRLFR